MILNYEEPQFCCGKVDQWRSKPLKYKTEPFIQNKKLSHPTSCPIIKTKQIIIYHVADINEFLVE